MSLSSLVIEIDQILPQTQCTRCGYPSCLEYAKAIVNNECEINQCPPGGDSGIAKLANLLDKDILPLNPDNGQIKPIKYVVIEEDKCIGCTLCIKACPVDSIIGSNKMMHTVIVDDCTGCELCIPACPVDCIILIDNPEQEWGVDKQNKYRDRYSAWTERKNRHIKEREDRLEKQAALLKKVRNEEAKSPSNDYIQNMISKLSQS